MELTPAQLATLQTFTIAANKLPTERLSIGQQLLATIIASDTKSGEIVLNINNTIINAKTSLPLRVNQTLQLLVAQTGSQVTLKLQDNLMNSLITEQAMRQVLPQQCPLSVAIRHIQQFLQQSPPTPIPPKLVQLANQFVKQLPTAQQLSTAEGVKSAIANSGLFLEKNLKQLLSNQPAVNLKKDIKSLFINLKHALTQEQSKVDRSVSQQQNTPSPQQTKHMNTQPLTVNENVVKTPARVQASTPPSPQNTPLNHAPQIKPQKIEPTGLAATNSVTAKNITTDIQPKIAPAATKTSEPPKQQVANNQTLPAQKLLDIQAKSVPRPLTAAAPPAPPAPISMPLHPSSTQQYHHKVNTSYHHNTHNPAKQALEFVATKTEAKQSSLAARISSLSDMIENLVKAVDSAISRTQLHQLNTLHEQDNGKLAWSFEVPVHDDEEIHLIQMEFEKEQNNAQEKDAVVSVNLAIELQTLGPIHARITLISDNISVVLWAEHGSTFKLAHDHMDELQENLQKSGFIAENISCHQGTPPLSHSREVFKPDNLVDLKV